MKKATVTQLLKVHSQVSKYYDDGDAQTRKGVEAHKDFEEMLHNQGSEPILLGTGTEPKAPKEINRELWLSVLLLTAALIYLLH